MKRGTVYPIRHMPRPHAGTFYVQLSDGPTVKATKGGRYARLTCLVADTCKHAKATELLDELAREDYGIDLAVQECPPELLAPETAARALEAAA